jgi:hypothetical protein
VGHLQSPYLPLLRLFAQACDVADRAWREMADEDLVRKGTRGGGANPTVKVWRDAAGTARALGEPRGLSRGDGPPWSLARPRYEHGSGAPGPEGCEGAGVEVKPACS